jgi:hypothetical protein
MVVCGCGAGLVWLRHGAGHGSRYGSGVDLETDLYMDLDVNLDLDMNLNVGMDADIDMDMDLNVDLDMDLDMDLSQAKKSLASKRGRGHHIMVFRSSLRGSFWKSGRLQRFYLQTQGWAQFALRVRGQHITLFRSALRDSFWRSDKLRRFYLQAQRWANLALVEKHPRTPPVGPAGGPILMHGRIRMRIHEQLSMNDQVRSHFGSSSVAAISTHACVRVPCLHAPKSCWNAGWPMMALRTRLQNSMHSTPAMASSIGTKLVLLSIAAGFWGSLRSHPRCLLPAWRNLPLLVRRLPLLFVLEAVLQLSR